jgi:hypothetical protein
MLNSSDNSPENRWECRTHTAPRFETAEHRDQSGGSGFVWLIAIVLAVIGLAAMGRHGANPLVVVPVGISLFFMFMFMLSHRRENRRIEAEQRLRRLERAAKRALDPDADLPDYEHRHEDGSREQRFNYRAPLVGSGTPYAAGTASPNNDLTRQVFDRFDVQVIELAREISLKPKEAANLLEFARDFVDVSHASNLLRNNRDDELECHLNAAIERAVLQHAISTNCEKMLKVKTKFKSNRDYMEPPF